MNRNQNIKKMYKKQNIKKMLSSCVVASMVLTAFATMLVIQAPSINAENGMDEIPSVRIYGEEGAVYPTQSYTGSEDFIYPSEEDPFDPGIIEKDSITFNPAFWYGHEEFEIQARGDASEKIFLRAFYEPGYTHDPDDLMGGCGALLEPVEQFDAIVTETTYFLTTLDDIQPNYGLKDQTKIALPYKSHEPDDLNNQPGMDVAGLLSVTGIRGGPKGPHCQPPYPDASLTDGSIRVEKMYEYDNIDLGTEEVTVRFMDHMVTFRNFEHQDPQNDKLDIEVFYTGNMDDEASHSQTTSVSENSWGHGPEYNYWFDRDNDKQGVMHGTDPCYRWFLRIENADDDYLRFVCGRWLVAGETFYVDGVRYDIPAVYVHSERTGQCRWEHQFKYITFQSPIPKGEHPIWESPFSDNIKDFSHVSSQYLAKLPMQVAAWLLPPFDGRHVMIDDIGLPGTCLDEEEIRGLILENEKDPLEIIYIDEAIEERFESSLMERLNTDDKDVESWYWYNVYTKPNRFTEFILPNQEIPGEPYEPIEGYYLGYRADGNEYLITTSFIAPNSEVSTDRCDNCKDFDEHEIFDRVLDIARNGERADYYEMPRFVFEFDAYNCDDFFVNEQPTEISPSVRIYGEQEFEYPTQSWTGVDDFIYEQEEDPFDPGVVKKDSITFNSALWYGHEEPPFGHEGIWAQGDASEKIFLRAFYEPGYTHDPDDLMDACSNVILKPVEQFDAIVTETTYFLVTLDERQPTVGYPLPDTTKMVLPYESTDEDNPGMEKAGMIDVIWTDNKGTPQLTDGAITVEMEFEFEVTDPYIGQTIQFMDHKVKFLNFENQDPMNDKLDVRVSYAGNMHDRLSAAETHTIKETKFKTKLWFDRANLQDHPDACHRWYMYIDSVSETYLRISLGRTLSAGETFYVDGVRYDIPAVYVNDNDGFKYITFQTPIPKTDGYQIWQSPLRNNIDDFSHVSSQYLASLPAYEAAWLLPPFNEDHVMIDDIGLAKTWPHGPRSNCFYEETGKSGKVIKEIIEPIEMYWILEAIEERFESSLMERLNTCEQSGNEEWCWWNIYTKPNRFTELIISDQETTDNRYVSEDGGGNADGNEYLITTSLIAPNSEVDFDRSDECKDFDEHEIFSMAAGGAYKSVYLVADHHASPTEINAYGIPSGGYPLSYQATYPVQFLGIGASGLAINNDPNDDGNYNDAQVLVTYESSGEIEVFNAVDFTAVDTIPTAGTDLAGIVVDQEKDLIYAVDRFTSNLYVYDADTFAPVGTQPITLSGLTGQGAVGLALDEINDWLFVTDFDSTVNYYDTANWLLAGTITTDSPEPSGIACDYNNGFIYTGGGFSNDNILAKFDMNTMTASSIDMPTATGIPGCGAIGLAVDIDTGLLYVTTGYTGDDLRVFDSDLNEVYLYPDSEGKILNPAGIAIPTVPIGYGKIYMPRFAFEFDASDGTGLYINCIEVDWPPTAVAGGGLEGYSGECGTPVMFDGSGSYDNDEGGASITDYRWDWTNDGIYDTGWSSSPTSPHTYTTGGTYTVKLQVKDNEGDTDTDEACVFIECDGGPKDPIADPNGPYYAQEGQEITFDGTGSYDQDESGCCINQYDWKFSDSDPWQINIGAEPKHTYHQQGTFTVTLRVKDNEDDWSQDALTVANIGVTIGTIQMHDVYFDCEAGIYYGYLKAYDFVELVGSVSINLTFGASQVSIESVTVYFDSSFSDSSVPGKLYLGGWQNPGNPKTGDFDIAEIGFEREGMVGCPLEIEPDSEVLTEDSIPSVIPYNAINGHAYIDCMSPPSGGVLGDMNGDDEFNMGDIRWLGIYVASGGSNPVYRPLYADGDVNSDGNLNMGDVRYLAIYYVSGGTNPKYSPLYPPKP